MTSLYRHYDKDGKLLYVGISLSAVSRLSQHRDSSHWYDEIHTVKIENFSSRNDALSAETEAIQSEKPLYNVQKRKKKIAVNDSKIKTISETVRQIQSSIPDHIDGQFLFRPNEAAERLGVALDDLNLMMANGEIFFVRFGSRTKRVPAREINRVLMGYDASYSVLEAIS